MKPPEGDRSFPIPSRLKSEEDRRLESLHFKGVRDCIARIPRAYAAARALPSPRPQVGWPNAARRKKREETPKEAARGPQMRPPEVLKGEREADRRLESLHFKG